jgi:hypothetical protein
VAVVGVAALGLLGTACTPPNELTLTLGRFGSVSSDGHTVTLGGTIACAQPGVVVLYMGTSTGFSGGSVTMHCPDAGDTESWAASFGDLDDTQPRGEHTASVSAYLFDADDDEQDDYVTVARKVTLS